MNSKNNNIIGLVGGMGPESGIEICRDILTFTNSSIDQDHLPVILMTYPNIEDRTAYIEGRINVNPALKIVEIIKSLEKIGANIVGIACNTSYARKIYDVIKFELRNLGISVNLVNMPYETCLFIKEEKPHIKRVGIMVTNGTYKSKVYDNELISLGLELVKPDWEFQNNIIHKMIYDNKIGIKSNPGIVTEEVQKMLNETITYFEKEQAEAIIIGCTEFSLVLKNKQIKGITIIDSSKILAKSLVREANSENLVNKNQVMFST